jgi:hypothetical protein
MCRHIWLLGAAAVLIGLACPGLRAAEQDVKRDPRLAKQAFIEALQAAGQIPDLPRRDWAVYGVVLAQAGLDPEGALAVVRSMGVEGGHKGIVSFILDEASARDPRLALRLLPACEREYGSREDLARIAELVRARAKFADDPDSFLAGSDDELSRNVEVLVQEDMDRAYQAAQRIWDPQKRDAALDLVVVMAPRKGWTAGDTEKRLVAAKAIQDKALRDSALAEALTALASQSPERALEILAEVESAAAHDEALQMIAIEFAHHGQPLRGLDLAQAILGQELREGALAYGVLAGLSGVDADRALAMADAIKGAMARFEARQSVLAALCRVDPDRALGLAREAPETERISLLMAMFGPLAQVGRGEEAFRMAAAIEGLEQRPGALEMVLGVMTRQQRGKATALVEQVTPCDRREEAMGILAANLTWISPEDALNMARRIEDPEQRAFALTRIGSFLTPR